MSERTGIAWTDRTWNPWQGCTRVSDGCARCYMAREKTRYGQDPWTVVRSKPPTFNAPLRWERELAAMGRTERVFVCSWSDFFHPTADAWRAEAWDIIHRCRHLVFQIPTKRLERILSRLPTGWGEGWPNVWLGASVENQAAANARVPELLGVPAAVRWLSLEPLLGPVGLREHLMGFEDDDVSGGRHVRLPHRTPYIFQEKRLHWLVVGGESGPGARPFDLAWARSLLAQGREAGVSVFVKQLGANPITEPGPLTWPTTHPAGADPAEWPEDLRVREMPRG